MYKFARNVSTMTGKNFAAGSVVPDGVFLAINEMVKAGDVVEVGKKPEPVELEPEVVVPEPENPEPVEEVKPEVEKVAKPRQTRKRK